MTISAIDIQEQGFSTARNGYDMQEVDVFLERVAEEIDNMQAEFQMQLQQVAANANNVNVNVGQYEMEIKRLNNVIMNLQSQVSNQTSETSIISDAIIAAQKSANRMKEEARLESEKAYREAEAKAREIVGEAISERQRVLNEIARLEKSRKEFSEQYLALIKHFQDEAIKTFPSEASNSAAAKSDRAQDAPSILFEAEPERNYGVSASVLDDYPVQSVPAASNYYEPAAPSKYEPAVQNNVAPAATVQQEPVASDDFDDFDIEEID